MVLVVIYKIIAGQLCVCLRDPGGREEERKKKKKKNAGYDKISCDDSESGDEIFIPPTLTVENVDEVAELGELVGPDTLSADSQYSAYKETASLDQTYQTERG